MRYGAPLPVITATKGMVSVRINPAESYMKVLRKTKESVDNLSIDKQNSAIGDQNPTIGNQSTTIGDSKQAIAKEKIDFGIIAIRISEKNYNEPTPSNIKAVYQSIQANQVFGASDVEIILKCSYTTAKSIIKKMNEDLNVIIPEKGFGKGKYRFKNFDEV